MGSNKTVALSYSARKPMQKNFDSSIYFGGECSLDVIHCFVVAILVKVLEAKPLHFSKPISISGTINQNLLSNLHQIRYDWSSGRSWGQARIQLQKVERNSAFLHNCCFCVYFSKNTYSPQIWRTSPLIKTFEFHLSILFIITKYHLLIALLFIAFFRERQSNL